MPTLPPTPMTPTQVGGAMTAATMIGMDIGGPANRGMVVAYPSGGGLYSAIADGTVIIPVNRLVVGTIPSLSPTTGVAATPVTLIVTHTGFTPDSRISVDGVNITTTYISPTEVRGSYTPASAGAKLVRVTTGSIQTGNATFTAT